MAHQHTPETEATPERRFAQDLRAMFNRATQEASAGMPWSDVIRTIVEAAERMADAKDREDAIIAAKLHANYPPNARNND